MSSQTYRRNVVIVDPEGFHMRPQKAFVQLAQKFQSTVALYRNDKKIDGKSLLDVMLFSVEAGTELGVETNGSDGQEALDALCHLLAHWHEENQ